MNSNKTVQNGQFGRMRFSAQIFVVGTILSATFFLLLIDSFKTYRSDVSILVSAKSEIALKQQEQLFSNIVEFPRTLAFYDRMLKRNTDVRDVAAGLTPDQRKSKWNSMLSVTRVGENSSVFKISIVSKHESDAQQLAVKTARTLFDTVAFYYDIQRDIDLRIIEGPITKSQVPLWYGLLLISVVAGFALAALLNSIFFSGRGRLLGKGDLFKKNFFTDFRKRPVAPVENGYRAGQEVGEFVFEEKEEELLSAPSQENTEAIENDRRLQEMKKITKKIEPGKYPNFAEMPVEYRRESSAPDNLPIADESYFMAQTVPQEPVEAAPLEIKEEAVPEETKEPTKEELKKRLNQLLRGEL